MYINFSFNVLSIRIPDNNYLTLYFTIDMWTQEALAMEMEREKYQYIEKAKYIQEQLVNFKTEIEDMKVSSIPSGFLWGGGGGIYFFLYHKST